MTKLIVDYLNFANTPKNSTMSLKCVVMFFIVISEKNNDISFHSTNILILYPELSL
jgi:hypothetical protein